MKTVAGHLLSLPGGQPTKRYHHHIAGDGVGEWHRRQRHMFIEPELSNIARACLCLGLQSEWLV